MPQTKEGAKKAKAVILQKHGEDFYARIGKIGGIACNPYKGFGSDHERARLAGIKGYKKRMENKNGQKTTY